MHPNDPGVTRINFELKAELKMALKKTLLNDDRYEGSLRRFLTEKIKEYLMDCKTKGSAADELR